MTHGGVEIALGALVALAVRLSEVLAEVRVVGGDWRAAHVAHRLTASTRHLRKADRFDQQECIHGKV